MRFKKEIKDRLYGGYLGVVTDKIDFEIIKVMLADDKKKVEGLEWPFGAVSAVIAVAPDGAVVALKEEHAESYELVKYQDAVEEDTQPIDADVNEVAEMPSLSVVKVIPAQIEGCNVKHFKEAVKSYLKRYDGIVVTADNYKELSDVVSKLKKEKDNVNESKKAVKKEAMKVYTDFENDMKEVLKMFDASISSLSSDIKEFTDKEVEENKKVVEALCKKAIHDYVERNDFNEYFAANFFNTNPRWNTLKKFINNHKPTKALVEEIKQECERTKETYKSYMQRCESLDIYLEARCKETDVDQEMIDVSVYKDKLRDGSFEDIKPLLERRFREIINRRDEQEHQKEEAKKEEVKQQEKPVNVSSEEKEPLKMLVGKIVGTNAALNELKTSLDYLKAKYDGCFDYDLRFPRKKKEGK